MLIALIVYCLLIPALALTLARRFAWARAIENWPRMTTSIS